jgi:hypothetical protein
MPAVVAKGYRHSLRHKAWMNPGSFPRAVPIVRKIFDDLRSGFNCQDICKGGIGNLKF